MIPPYLLAKLYIKGSLKNTQDGFEFSLKNFIDATLLTGIGPIVVVGPVIVGETRYEAETIHVQVGDEAWSGEQVSRQNPVPVRMNTTLRISVQGKPLEPGDQHVIVRAVTSDIGAIRFEIKDNLAE